MKNIVGIGLANIDLVSHIQESFLHEFDLIKGQAKRITPKSFIKLREALESYQVEAGGCVGNTLSGMDKRDISATFFGKIGNDKYAKVYRDSFRDHDVLFPVHGADMHSSQCAVLVTPDGERTFAYMRGASWLLSPEDVYFESINAADLVYTEIYAMAFGMNTGLWPALVNHMRSKRKVMALKTVDQEYAELYRTTLFGLAEEGILVLLIGNKDNLCALARRDNVSEALDAFSKWQCAVLLTDGPNGVFYNKGEIRYHHEVEVVENPLNTSGAGDQFVAGFLEKFIFDRPLKDCMENGERKARKAIMQDAPRP